MAMRVQNKTKKSTSGIRNTNRAAGAYSGDAYHDDGSDDEGAISLAAIKNKYKKGAAVIPSKGNIFYIILKYCLYIAHGLNVFFFTLKCCFNIFYVALEYVIFSQDIFKIYFFKKFFYV